MMHCGTRLTPLQILPRDPSLPPEVFHAIPIFGSAVQYGNDPLNFFAKCREKVCYDRVLYWSYISLLLSLTVRERLHVCFAGS